MQKSKFFILWISIFLVSSSLVFSQTTESGRLLQQAFENVDSNPDEALKVAQHLIKTSDGTHQKSEAYLLNALANYTKGNYDQSLNDAFEARNLSTGKKGEAVFDKSTNLISEILSFLQLNQEAKAYKQQISDKNNLTQNKSGEADLHLKKADEFFQNKENNASVSELEKALIIAKQINNSFLQLEIHQKLAANYLILNDKQKYHEHNQEALVLRKTTYRIENSTANTAHQLINEEKDKQLADTKSLYSNAFWMFFSVLILCVLVKLILIIRNRNKLKTYANLLNYLNKENSTEKEVQPEIISEEIPNEPRQTTILKESENQILLGLQKFESSKRFISKDMSLGMLAAQLNTNTKYLSEIINRNKEKNFNSYINELRINYITEKIKNEPAYLNYKVSYLAEECGFASHSTFTTVFKSVVGVSPITFVDFVKNEINSEKAVAAS